MTNFCQFIELYLLYIKTKKFIIFILEYKTGKFLKNRLLGTHERNSEVTIFYIELAKSGYH